MMPLRVVQKCNFVILRIKLDVLIENKTSFASRGLSAIAELLVKNDIVRLAGRRKWRQCSRALALLVDQMVTWFNWCITQFVYLQQSKRCQFKLHEKLSGIIKSWVDLPIGNETAMLLALKMVGPLAAAVDARPISFQVSMTICCQFHLVFKPCMLAQIKYFIVASKRLVKYLPKSSQVNLPPVCNKNIGLGLNTQTDVLTLYPFNDEIP